MSSLDTDREWKFWGRHDPLFAVASRPGREVGGPRPWTADEFFETGRLHFADVYRQWQQYGVGADHCVEIGCGSGGITRQLIRRFRLVTGVDVSPEQLENARRLLGEEAHGLRLALVSEQILPFQNASCDAVFTCEVFQHFDSDGPIAEYVHEAHRVLIPGGSICFQLPVRGIYPPSFLASRPRNVLLRVLRMLGRRRMMLYRQYPADVVLGLMHDTEFQDIQMRLFQTSGSDWFHAYFFGRRLGTRPRPEARGSETRSSPYL